MSSRRLLVLTLVTLVLIIGAVVAYTSRSSSGTADRAQRLFSGLSDRINDIAQVELQSANERATISRGERAWGLDERSEFPVQFDRLKTAIVDVSEMSILEPKTSKPELFGRIGVEDPDQPGATSTRLTMRDEAGEIVASVILGQRSGTGQSPGQYVRRSGEQQSWLVDRAVDVSAEPVSWLTREILEIPRDRVQQVIITHADGEVLEVFRDSKDEPNFEIAEVPEGRKLRYPGVAGPIGTALVRLRLEDVAAPKDKALDPEQETVAEFTTFDGLVITVRTGSVEEGAVDGGPVEGQTWAQLQARAATPGEGDETAEAVLEQVAEINGRVTGWLFRLSEGQAASLTKRMDDLTEEVEPENAMPVEPEAAGPSSTQSSAEAPKGSSGG